MSEKLKWGIIGAGNIAKAFANGVAGSQSGTLVAIGSRSQETADKFGDQFNVPNRHSSYEALLADPEVQAVYIATPHPLHAEWAIKAAAAGKHILCEKPLTLNASTAMSVINAARENDVFLMEAFMYRCHPQTAKLAELIRENAIGEVRHIRASFAFNAGFAEEGRLFENAMGGGGILDVGCYPVSMSRLIAGAANGKSFIEPIEVKAVGRVGETGVDEWTSAVALFPGDIVAQWTTGIRISSDNTVVITGTEGTITLNDPWVPARDGGQTKIIVERGGETEEIVIDSPIGLYSLEADEVARSIPERQSPKMSHDDTLGNLRTLDLWREQIGLAYPSEKPDFPVTARGAALSKRSDSKMKYGRVAGIDKDISRLVYGCDNQSSYAHAAVVFDDFYERGGNAFDTGYIYAGGAHERLLGEWMKNRGVRDDVMVIVKGAHTPHCNPTDLTAQLEISLDRLQTDHADLYMMHRDNLEIPVSEFVDVLNEHHKAGRIRAFGGSNWSIERVEAANAYAKEKGLIGFSGVSNNFSLARMVNPVWDGCIAASDPESRAWFEKTQLALLPWSSQARGFFIRGDRNFTADEELVRCWYSDDNFARLERVQQMAQERGWSPINIALAYVLAQPFPTFPLIGPRTVEEARSSFGGLDIELSPEDVKWLNLEA
jgi:predicted dehydrogenase/aryl-alcohol dehydrogenase-like predicted oxidoreductase